MSAVTTVFLTDHEDYAIGMLQDSSYTANGNICFLLFESITLFYNW